MSKIGTQMPRTRRKQRDTTLGERIYLKKPARNKRTKREIERLATQLQISTRNVKYSHVNASEIRAPYLLPSRVVAWDAPRKKLCCAHLYLHASSIALVQTLTSLLRTLRAFDFYRVQTQLHQFCGPTSEEYNRTLLIRNTS